MENIYSVRIIRKENQAVEGEYIKQFWMFCGVYVKEFVLEYASNIQDGQEVDCNIFLTEKENIENQDVVKMLCAKREIKINLRYGRFGYISGEKWRKNLGDELKWQLLGNLTDFQDDISGVYDAFCNNDMAYINYICHLYLYQFDLEDNQQFEQNKKEKIIERYIQCLKAIYKPGEGFEGSVYRKFAYLNCGRKINRIYQANRQLPYVNVETIMREAELLNIEDPKFSMGNVLAGLAGLSEYRKEKEAEICLYNAINQEKNQKYSAFIYYSLGHYYETTKHDWSMGWELYKRIESLDPYSYRYKFKYGCKQIREENYESAGNIFMQIYSQMKNRSDDGGIMLLEMEYYYKCAKLLNEMQNQGIILGGNDDTLVETPEMVMYKLNNNKFLNEFLSDEERKEIEGYFKLKMEGHTISKMLGR